MRIHDLKQGSKEWLRHRATSLNASDAPAMLGCSSYRTRSQLLHEIATGITPEVGPELQRRYDNGHRSEALARPLMEQIVGEELYPVVGTEGRLSASFDGLTLMGDMAGEHKALNDTLRACMVDGCTGADLPLMYQVQMQQQCMVAGCSRVLFMASKWDGEALVEERHCWYESNPELAERIRAGWEQFAIDLAAYIPEPAPAADPIAAVIESLPALVVNVEGRVVNSNLAPFKAAAESFLAKIKTDLQSDQDFADAERTVKFCKDGEERLELVKAQALAQTASIDDLFRTIDAICESMRAKRLALDKLVKTRKESIRGEIVAGAQAELDAHVAKLNARLGTNWLPRMVGGFGEAIKGKKTVASVREACSVALANAKIDLNAVADRLEMNRRSLVSDGKDSLFLFADFASVGRESVETFSAIAAQRIGRHQQELVDAAERKRVADEAALLAADIRARQAQEARDAWVVEQATARAAAAEPPAHSATHAAPSPASPTPLAAAAPRTQPDTRPPFVTSALCERLGFTVRVEMLKCLGINPVLTPLNARNGIYWAESDYPEIKAALVRHIQSLDDAPVMAGIIEGQREAA